MLYLAYTLITNAGDCPQPKRAVARVSRCKG